MRNPRFAIRHSPFAIRNLQQAATWYSRYHALAPDDLLGLKKLAEVCTALKEAGVEDKSCGEATERVIRDSPFSCGSAARGAGSPHRWLAYCDRSFVC